jgi:DNA-binding response OmpR family regulator
MTVEGKKFNIVVAEDNPADLTLVREALKHHKVRCALHVIRDGEQVMNYIDRLEVDPQTPSIDLLILDMHLPKCDGEEILKWLRSTEKYAQIPVVVMTGLDSAAVASIAARNAAPVYFRKPSSFDEFLQLGSIVRSVLKIQQIGDGASPPGDRGVGGTA